MNDKLQNLIELIDAVNIKDVEECEYKTVDDLYKKLLLIQSLVERDRRNRETW